MLLPRGSSAKGELGLLWRMLFKLHPQESWFELVWKSVVVRADVQRVCRHLHIHIHKYKTFFASRKVTEHEQMIPILRELVT